MCRAPVAEAIAPNTPPAEVSPSRRTVLVVSALMGALVVVGVPSVLLVSAPWSDARAPLSQASASRVNATRSLAAGATGSAAYGAQDQRRAGDTAYGRGNLEEAARTLGIDPATLYRKRQKLGLL